MTVQHDQIAPSIIRSSYTLQKNSLEIPPPTLVEMLQCLTHLLESSQVLCGQMHTSVSRLSQEVTHLTQGHAQLLLHNRNVVIQRLLPPNTINRVPVYFGNTAYGSLCLKADPLCPESAALPLPIAQLLAQICAWLLYTLEQSAFIQGQCQRLDYHIHGPLTRREKEVLVLMCHGYKQETIGEMLSITPATVGKHRQHIYERLGVHCEQDALLVAYHTGLFSIIESVSS